MNERDYLMRSATVTRKQAGNRPALVVLATNEPVWRLDSQTGKEYLEVLDLDGIQFRTSKRQVPIIDSGNLRTIRAVHGSVRNLRVDGGRLLGEAYFARNEASQMIRQNFMDGHIDRFDIMARWIETQPVSEGKQVKVGQRFVRGPAVVVKRWVPINASLSVMRE